MCRDSDFVARRGNLDKSDSCETLVEPGNGTSPRVRMGFLKGWKCQHRYCIWCLSTWVGRYLTKKGDDGKEGEIESPSSVFRRDLSFAVLCDKVLQVTHLSTQRTRSFKLRQLQVLRVYQLSNALQYLPAWAGG